MSLFHTRHNTGGRYADEVIIGGNVYSVSKLRGKARRLTMRMWASVAVTLLIAMTIVPYLAQAATNGNNSDAFNGTVIPGYSMGGVSVTAYGVDVNSWGTGRSDSGAMAKSNYGIWSGSRVTNASNDGTTATDMTSDAKSSGWKSITGRQNYSATNPNGQDTSSTSTDTVNPYRTASDSTYWDAQTASASATEAGITVSWLPEFICVGVGSDGQATVLTNPDDATSIASDQSMILKQNGSGYTTQASSAIPHYISLKDLFDAYGLKESKDTMTDLTSAMQQSKAPLNSLLDDKHNLLYGTSYSDLNGSTGESSDAFNPYPYAMVFTKTDNGKQVVSGIYENCEAYVYFSPQSMYQAYTTLEQEYESIVSANADKISSAAKGSVSDASLILTLGYYQAAMSICEAYLSEALPQDMTRGYVGPSEPSSVNGSTTSTNGGNWRADMPNGITLSGSPTESSSFQNYTYATIMYDVANWLVSKGTDGSKYCLAQTNATMDTLSTFGYNVNDKKITTGVMKGMNAAQTYNRMTAFTAYSSNIQNDTSGIDDSSYKSIDASALKNQKNTGLYIAPYYPIQQHCIPSSQASYRFSIITALPFQTVKAYLSAFGFGAGTSSLSYTTGQFDTSSNAGSYASLPTDTDVSRLQTLMQMFQESSNDDTDSSVTNKPEYILNNTNYQADVSMVLHPENAKNASGNNADDGSNDSKSTGSANTALSAQQRVDQALMNYGNSSMTADNVHDLCDVMRSISGLKYETFMRFYNPLKSSGSPTDVYLTRVSPANNSYMPTILVSGYSAAGGTDITNGNERTDTAAYDYFSLPSFAPCFAQHTASDCYYGSLNYELRAFLQIGFLSTLNTGTGGLNIPAVEAMSQVKQAAEQMAENEIIDGQKMKQNVTSLYLAAQSYALLKTFYDTYNGDVNVQVNTLVSYLNSGTVQGGADSEAKAAGKNTNYKTMSWAENFQALQGQDSNTDVLTIEKQDAWFTITFISDWIAGITGNGESWGKVKVYNYDAAIGDKLKNKIIAGGSGSVKDTTDDGKSGQFNHDDIRNLIFSYTYRNTLMSLIGPGGDYYWGIELTDNGSDRGTLPSYTGIDTIFSNASNVSDKISDADVVRNNLGKMVGTFTAGDGDEPDVAKAKSKMDEAAANLFTEVNQFYEALGDLSSATPTQMQNALAWADYQDASSSQNAYQSDPSQATTSIVVNTGNKDSSKADTQVTNISAAKKLGADWDDQGGLSGTAQSSNTMQSKTKRGVEGTTSTNTGNPAAYTTTATLSRIREMNQQNVTYPYSGLATSSLAEGISRYLQMQSHVADYSSIANKLNNDLANWQTTNVVSLDWGGTDSNLLDFDVLGQVQAFISSMAGSIVQIGGDLFTSQMFPNKNSTSTQKFAGTNVSGAGAVTQTLPSTGNANSYTAALNVSTPNSTRKLLTTSYGNDLNTAMSMAAAADNDDGNNHASLVGNNVGTASVNFILNTDVGKNVYKFLQSLALVFVLITLIVIAFQNMMVYTTGSSLDFIAAQTTLKRVLPRAVLAVFMIGLPPIGGGTGFQGGGFLLLEAINSIVRQIGSVFSSIEGTGIVDMTVKAFQSADNNLFTWIICLLLALIILITYIIGAVFVFFLNIFLFLFFLLSPLAWAAYIWPFDSDGNSGNDDGTIYGTIFQRITKRLGSKTFTGSKVGSEAAAGFVGTFLDAEIIYLIYVLMLWFVSYIFVGTAGDAWLQSTNTTGAKTSFASLVFLTLLNCMVIYAMGKLLMDDFHNTNAMKGMRNIANGVVNGVKKGAELAHGVAAPIKAMSTANKMGNAVAAGLSVNGNGIDTKGALAKAIGDGSLEAVSGDGSNLGFAQQALKDANDALSGTMTESDKASESADAADADSALPKSESGAVMVHADNFDEKEEEPKTAGQVLGGSLKQLGQGLLDGDSKAVGTALGGMGTATQLAAANAVYDISSGNASLNPHLITKSKYALGTVLDAASTTLTRGKDVLAAGVSASKQAYDSNVGVRQNLHAMNQSARAAKAGVREAYSQLNGALPENGATAMQNALAEEQKSIYDTHDRKMQALAARAQADYAGTDKLDENSLKEAQAAENARFFRAQQQFNNDERHAQLAAANEEQKAMLNAGNIKANMRRDENGNQVNGGEAIADSNMKNAYNAGYDKAAASLQRRIDKRTARANGETAFTKQNRQIDKSDILKNGGQQAYRAEEAAVKNKQAAYKAQRDTNLAAARSVILDQAERAQQNRTQRALDAQRQERLSNDIATGKYGQQPATATPASGRNAMPVSSKPKKQASSNRNAMNAADAYIQRQTEQRHRAEAAQAKLEQKAERQKRYDDDLAAGKQANLEEGMKQRRSQTQMLGGNTANQNSDNSQRRGLDGKQSK